MTSSQTIITVERSNDQENILHKQILYIVGQIFNRTMQQTFIECAE